MNIIIIFATIEGQTRRIVDRLKTHLTTNGHSVSIGDATASFEHLRRIGAYGPLSFAVTRLCEDTS
ncbi:MAG: hypothetical protein AAFR71_08990 [Pseudomonadota bacterium]